MMASALSASSVPVEEAFQTSYELISAGEPGSPTPLTMLGEWGLSDVQPAPRVEVLVHEYPLWILPSTASHPYQAGLAAEHPGFAFELTDPNAESTALTGQRGPWIEEAADRLAELAELGPGWDGHGGHEPEFSYISQAIEFLSSVMRPTTPTPSIVPTSDGGLQLEWHRAGLDVEILFSPEEDPVLYIHERATEEEWEVPAVGGFLEFDLGMRLAD